MSAARDGDPRSSARVHVALTHRLTLVVAAPGWGKTTMLRELASAAPAVQLARPPAGWTPFSLARQLVDQLVAADLADDLLPPRLAPDSADHHTQSGALAAAVCAAAGERVVHHTLVTIDDADVDGDQLDARPECRRLARDRLLWLWLRRRLPLRLLRHRRRLLHLGCLLRRQHHHR